MIFQQTADDRKVRVFSLSPAFLDQFRDRQPNWGPVGYFTYKRCVTVDTPVLCDDLVWRPAGSLDKGQGVIGFDEEPVRVHHYDYRYIRLGTVLHNSIEEAEVVGIKLEDGTVLYAMPDHPWLVKYAVGNRVYWRESKDLQATKKGGDVYLMRPFGPVWDTDETYEGGFLSAAYDGEGSLDRLNGVTFTQRDNAFLTRVEDYLTGKGVPYKKSPKKTKKGRMFTLRTHGLRHLLPFLGALQPPRLLGRFRDGVAKNLAGTLLRCAPEDWVKVISIFPAGVRRIAVLSTDIKTHFTGGFASHNTYARDLPDGSTEEFWQTLQRVVEGTFNIQKVHCRQMGLPWKEDKAQKSAQEMFQRMWDFKFTPPGRGLWMMGTDLVYDRGSAALQNCFSGDTEIITVEGVRAIGPLAGTVQTLLTRNGAWIDAPIRSFGKQRLWRLTLQRQGIEKVIFCTGDHRWFACDRRQAYRDQGHTEFKTSELRPDIHRLQYVFGQGIKGNVRPSPFGIAHGFTYGDGRSAQGVRNANSVPLPNFFRRRPPISENKAYLLGWLMGYFAADGSVSNGQAVISSARREDIEFYRDVCCIVGIGTYSIGEDRRVSNLTGEPHVMYRMSLMRDTLIPEFFLIAAHQQSFEENKGDEVPKRHWTVTAVEETDREEEVFCATVEGHGAFALEGNILTGNCAFVSTENIGEDFAAPFCFLMDLSMLGVGVGSDTRGAGKARLRMPQTTDEPFVVDDSREGWVDLLRTILNSFVGKGAYPLVIDYSKVRGRGSPIKTFGGTASGPKPLQMLTAGVTGILLPKGVTAIFDVVAAPEWATIDHVKVKFKGKGTFGRITSTQIVDVFNFVGKCVVAGGVRRTAEIMFGEPDDHDFITLKQDQAALDDRRWASNNSIFAYVGMDYASVAASLAKNGEPGLLWLENSRRFSRMNGVEDNKDWRVMGTNPCVAGDTITMTSEGPRRADRLVGQQFKTCLGVGKVSVTFDSTPEGFFVTGQKPVYLLQTKEGHSLKLTLDHPMRTALRVTRDVIECDDIPAGELQPGALLVLNDTRKFGGWAGPGTYNEGWLLGSMLGDGHLHKGDGGYAVLQFWGAHRRDMLDSALSRIRSLGGPDQYHDQRTGSEIEERDCCAVKSKKVWGLAAEFGVTSDKEFSSDALLLASSGFQQGFLRGLFDADGSVQGNQEKGVSVRLSSSTKQHLIFAQRMLLGLGINSTIYWNRREAGERLLPDGHGGEALYPTKDQHELVISKDNLLRFREVVGFYDPDKSEALVDLLGQYRRTLNRERFLATFESLTYLGVETVYDCTIPQNHHFPANGFVAHNCGEQPLESFELCNLVETYPAHHDSYEDFERTLKMAYLYAKTVTLVPTHDMRANAVMMRNRRIGCSMSGIVQAVVKLGRRRFLQWCDQGYGYVQKLDRIYSDWLGIPLSVKTTTVKPSGCRPWYALTCTNHGLLTLEELFKDHPEGQDWADIAGNVEADGNGCRVSRSYVNGTVPVNRITLSYGLTLESSLNHQWEVTGKELDSPRKKGGVSSRFVPYLVPAWVATKDLQPGDVLSVHPGVYKHRTARVILKPLSSVALKMRGDADEIRQPDTMTPELAWFLGYLWGDGAMSPSKWRLRWVDGVRANLDKAVKILHDLFGIEAEVKPASGTRKAWTVEVASKMLWHWLIKNGIFKYDADRLDLIPHAVRVSGSEVIIAFVAGLLDADGSVGAWGRWGKAVITTADARFAQHLQDVCWAVGLCFGRGHQTKGKSLQSCKSMWHLTSAAVMDTGAFDLLVRHSVKAGAFAAAATFPGWHHEHAERTLRVGKVLSNESAGEMPTFDVEVEQAHWYYAGAVKSHNTVSLLCGATPGIHYPHSEYYIRHIRVANTSPLVQAAIDAGFEANPDPYADDTTVIAFPVHEKHFVKGKNEVTLWEQFLNAADMQAHWADNQVSVTVTFKKDEARDIGPCLEAFETRLKGVSMLPLKDGDHGYKFAPYVAIDQPTYEAMAARVRPMVLSGNTHEDEDRFCSGDKCTLPVAGQNLGAKK